MSLRRGILVNDHVDVALALGAAGVHLKSSSVSPRVVRKIAPSGFVITVACHSLKDIMVAEGADYVLVSPVFSPLSKIDDREPLGLDALRNICAASAIPVLALGGITRSNAPACTAAGALGVAGISLFEG